MAENGRYSNMRNSFHLRRKDVKFHQKPLCKIFSKNVHRHGGTGLAVGVFGQRVLRTSTSISNVPVGWTALSKAEGRAKQVAKFGVCGGGADGHPQ